jgi:hypothetical protein
MRNLLLTATILLSSAAFGQFGSSLQISVQSLTGTDNLSVGPTLCGQTSSFNWQVVGTPCSDLSLWITTDNDCKETANAQTAGSVYELSSITRTNITSAGGRGTATFNVSSLPIFNATATDGGTARTCSADVELEDTMLLCAAARSFDTFGTSCATTWTEAGTALEISYDTKRPTAPAISQVASLDKALRVTVNAPEDAAQVRVVATLAGVEVSKKQQGVDVGAVRVENLQNDVAYQIEAYAIDAAGNQSPASAAQEGTPTRALGFYERYREAGGEETGCGATGGGFAGGGMLAALGFWLFSRRNRS